MLDTPIEPLPPTLTPQPPPPASVVASPNLSQAVWAHFIAPYHAGHQPFTHTRTRMVTGVAKNPDPIPAELVIRDHTGHEGRTTLVEGRGYAALIQQIGRNLHVTSRAVDAETASRRADEVIGWFPEAIEPDGFVPVEFWQTAGPRLQTTTRSIEAPCWDDVAHHYPCDVRDQLASVLSQELGQPDGRVILWHGPPGTGKTSAIRALARAWSDAARLQVVLEPERVFRDSSGLMQVLLDGSDRADRSWRVLVIEDADALVRLEARGASVLSSLLNVGDGLVGQGLRILVLLTTNEPPERLHPALSRPGRCLSNIAFRPFTPSEARAAFPDVDDSLLRADRTLAELTNRAAVDPVATTCGTTYL